MLPAPPNCATGTLAPYAPSAAKPWDKRRVMHLYRRLGFGASPPEIQQGLAMDPGTLVDTLLNTARNQPPSAEPEWAYWDIDKYDDFNRQRMDQFISWVTGWVDQMAGQGIREKFTLFWHNHFVTRFEVYQCPSHLYQYHRLLQEQAFGNFKNFVYEIGKTPAMLVFLNGVQNTRLQPNENYARELYELFTLGRDNGYTQDDIVETARALTGWNGFTKFCAPIGYAPALHDPGEKTIFGRTGNWNYEDVHRLLFEERGELVAEYICSKLYRHFVHPEPDENIIAGLATTFLENDFEVAPVLRQLFRSEHFFDDYVVSAVVQSPVDRFISFVREGGVPTNDALIEALTFQTYQQGQQLFNPVDVAGWPGNRNWINSNTLTGRWQTLRYYAFYLFENTPDSLTSLAVQLAGEEATDPAFVTQMIVDHFLPNGLQRPEDYERATDVFKFEIPQNYFDEGLWNLRWETVPTQVALLLDHIIRLPEFQLG